MSSSAPEETPAAEPAPEPAASGSPCPNCGARLEPGQQWCLECGRAARTRVVGARGWRAPAAIVAVVGALAAAGIAVGLVSLSDDTTAGPAASVPPATARALTPTTPATTLPGGTATTPTSTIPAATVPATNPPATLPPASAGTQPGGATPPATTTPAPTAPATVASWPAGQSGYTVVLFSSTRSGARAKARSLAAQGVEVGVLDSSRYRSLNPGYFVVFSGRYGSQKAAEAAVGRLRARAPAAYVRFVRSR